MKLTRVNKIRGHRVFRDFVWPDGRHSFGQFNVIYDVAVRRRADQRAVQARDNSGCDPHH